MSFTRIESRLSQRSFQMQPSGRVLAVIVTRGRTEGYVRIVSVCFSSFLLSRSSRPIAITYTYVSCLLVFPSYTYQSSLKALLAYIAMDGRIDNCRWVLLLRSSCLCKIIRFFDIH